MSITTTYGYVIIKLECPKTYENTSVVYHSKCAQIYQTEKM